MPARNTQKWIIILTILFTLQITFANVKEHVGTIGKGSPPSGSYTQSNSSESGSIVGQLFGEFLKPVFQILLMPLAPIIYVTFKGESGKDKKAKSNRWVSGYGVGSGNEFKTHNFYVHYGYHELNFSLDVLRAREKNYFADFLTGLITFTPNWDKNFKTGVSAGFRTIVYEEDIGSITKGSYNGVALSFPAEWRVTPEHSLIYEPSYIFYNTDVNAVEFKGGYRFYFNHRSALTVNGQIKNLSGSKNDLTYYQIGLVHSF